MAWATRKGYVSGLNDTYPDYHIIEMSDAAKSWKEAETDHRHTSFYGIEKIRYMRAYWLGRNRAYRWANCPWLR